MPRPTKGVLVPLTDHVALVSLTSEVSSRSLMQVAAAVQKQITRDFTPFWGLRATVDAFDDLSSVPSDYHHVIVFGDSEELMDRLQFAIGERYAAELIDDFERDRLSGLHLNTFTRQPFALVAASDTWSVTMSHEVLEMIADPFGNRLVAAAHPLDTQQRVKYLLEVCDPCQAMWYPVNGVPVSDFYTPRYFDPVAVDRSRYSFTGELEHPLQILEGGYLSWIDPQDSGLYQLGAGESEAVLIAGLLDLARSTAPLRTVVDTSPQSPQLTRESLRPASTAAAAFGAYDAVLEASDGAAMRTAEVVFSLADGAG
ncbi:MAG: hypothetical protein ACRDK0_07725 [Solirubrobacteraceae bacterium]